MEMSIKEKADLIRHHLQETVDGDKIEEILKTKGVMKIYWGTATTGSPHFGYLVPIYKIADFLAAGQDVTILFADLHAFLDNLKSTWELLQKRVKYYEFIIKEMLKVIGVPLDKLHFVRGTDFQLGKEYTLDMYKITSLTTTDKTKHAGAAVVKQTDVAPLMSSLLYPILQALDEEYLGVDAQFGGVDQRKIFMFAREQLPRIGYQKRIHLMNPLIPGLTEDGKMSSSVPNSKIDFIDSDAVIKKKIKQAFSVDGKVEGNGLLCILKYILFRKLESEKREFLVDRDEKYGGPMAFKSYEEVEKAFEDGKLVSADLKKGVITEVQKFVAPLRKAIEDNIELFQEAYPSPKKKKVKKTKVNPFGNYCNAVLETERDNYPDKNDKEIIKLLKLGQKFGKLPMEEKQKYMS